MKIKGFKDGSTFVLTFDGAEQKFIDVLIDKFKPELLAEVAAEPIIVEQNEVEDSKKELPEDRVFEKGPLKGMTVVQALSKEKDKAFKLLSFYVSSGKLPEEMHKYCSSCLNDYITYRFEGYAGKTGKEILLEFAKLSREKINEFIDLFSPLIKAEMWSAVNAESASIIKLNDKQSITLATLIVLRGVKLSGK